MLLNATNTIVDKERASLKLLGEMRVIIVADAAVKIVKAVKGK
jgi:hypothetical protein